MVDLAKIRKKATKGAEGRAQGAVEEAAPAPPPVPPAEVSPTTDNRQPTTESKLDAFKRDAGKRRETAQIAAIEQTREQIELLTFLIAGEQYAVEIERIVEIVPPRPVTRIPNADDTVVGIISLRGTIVTLVDVRRKLRHPPGEVDPNTRIVVIDFRNETVGFAVDRVLRVVKLPAAEVEPHPVVHSTELEEAIRGVFRTTGALTILLDLDKLLDSHAVALNPWT
jgi:purine-binding chemotaxis protein CheW